MWRWYWPDVAGIGPESEVYSRDAYGMIRPKIATALAFKNDELSDKVDLLELNCPSCFTVEERPDEETVLKRNQELYLVGCGGYDIVSAFGIEKGSHRICGSARLMVHPACHRTEEETAMMADILNMPVDMACERPFCLYVFKVLPFSGGLGCLEQVLFKMAGVLACPGLIWK